MHALARLENEAVAFRLPEFSPFDFCVHAYMLSRDMTVAFYLRRTRSCTPQYCTEFLSARASISSRFESRQPTVHKARESFLDCLIRPCFCRKHVFGNLGLYELDQGNLSRKRAATRQLGACLCATCQKLLIKALILNRLKLSAGQCSKGVSLFAVIASLKVQEK
jgi:hypothetical protein